MPKEPEQPRLSLLSHQVCPPFNETTRFKTCEQWFEYQHLLLLRDIWWLKF